MVDFFKNILSSESFMPHGHCFLWSPDILWLSVVSDAIIATAYYAIPPTLFYFARRKKNLPFVWMFILFCGFILLCGTTHLIDIWTIWVPTYRVLAFTKAATAAISIVTAMLLIPIVPKALQLRGPAELEAKNRELEREMKERERLEKLFHEQQIKIAESAKMSALGEMAGGIAHEINSPLATIKATSSQMNELLSENPLNLAALSEMASVVEKTTDRIAKIIHSLKVFSRDGSKDPYQRIYVATLIEDTLSFCQERFKNHQIKIILEAFSKDMSFEGRSVEISQVILNLLNNAHDAILGLQDRWVKISAIETPDTIQIRVSDSGKGIPDGIKKKIFQPFFTTKDTGKGTGMGLSISLGILQNHQGDITIDELSPNTCFVVHLPKKQNHVLAT